MVMQVVGDVGSEVTAEGQVSSLNSFRKIVSVISAKIALVHINA